jgi:hypothetical protein
VWKLNKRAVNARPERFSHDDHVSVSGPQSESPTTAGKKGCEGQSAP